MAGNFDGFKELQKFFDKLNPEVQQGLVQLLDAGASKIQRLAKQAVNVGVSGDLRNDITKSSFFNDISRMRVIIGNTLEYAPYHEFGTQAHWMPEEPLVRWGKLKGLTRTHIHFIWLKIGQRGTKAHPYLIPAYNKVAPKFPKAVEKYLTRWFN